MLDSLFCVTLNRFLHTLVLSQVAVLRVLLVDMVPSSTRRLVVLRIRLITDQIGVSFVVLPFHYDILSGFDVAFHRFDHAVARSARL